MKNELNNKLDVLKKYSIPIPNKKRIKLLHFITEVKFILLSLRRPKYLA
jgi:hypothetical protein